MGAKFLAASLMISLIYLAIPQAFSIGSLVKRSLAGVLFILISTLVGKLIGIGYARLRLALIKRRLGAINP